MTHFHCIFCASPLCEAQTTRLSFTPPFFSVIYKQARGIASQAKGVAIEALGEARTIVKDVRNKGLYGLVGLFGSGGGGAPGRGAGRGNT